MTDHNGATVTRVVVQGRIDGRPNGHDHAAATLSDTKFLVYIMVKTAQHFIALAAKRWPDAR